MTDRGAWTPPPPGPEAPYLTHVHLEPEVDGQLSIDDEKYSFVRPEYRSIMAPLLESILQDEEQESDGEQAQS